MTVELAAPSGQTSRWRTSPGTWTRLATAIAEGPTDIGEVLDVRDQAEALRAYPVSVRAAQDLVVEAAEACLRAERPSGELLLAHVRLGNSRTQL